MGHELNGSTISKCAREHGIIAGDLYQAVAVVVGGRPSFGLGIGAAPASRPAPAKSQH